MPPPAAREAELLAANLHKPYVPRLLRGLATGEISLTHDAFHRD